MQKQAWGANQAKRGTRRWLGYAAAAVGVAVMTGLIHLIPGASHIADISMLYLLVVIALALRFGSLPASFASLLAFLAFDWFFVQPLHTFTVSDPAEWIALVMFLLTAIVTGQLTALLRARAEEARRREREAVALAEASWAVASRVDRGRALAAVLDRLADVLQLSAAAILIADETGHLAPLASRGDATGEIEALATGPAQPALAYVLEQGGAIGWEGESRLWEKALAGTAHPAAVYLPLTVEGRTLGVLYLLLRDGQTVAPEERRVVESLATHAAVVLERDRLSRAEAHGQALAEADRLKTALLSMVSHDFRSPLASIKAGAAALQEGATSLDPATRQELFAGIDQEVDRLNRMIGNILALSRLEADAWRPQWEATSPVEIAGMALQPFSAEQNRRIRVSADPALAEVWLDPVQIVQVLHNLVDNALKYSPADQPVDLAIRRDPDGLAVEVLDRGPGLPPGEEERVFERFYRAPGLRESAVAGVGIGLAVCRGLVEAHGGQLTAQPRAGGGAVFRFTLPIHAGAPEPVSHAR